jgi:hypothetical protein
MKCAGNTDALHECQSSLSRFRDEKDRLIRPLGRARGDGPWFGLVSGMMFPSCFPSRCRLSPLFDEDGQIFIFPAPISCLGEPYLPAATKLSAKGVPRHKAKCRGSFDEQNLKSPESWLGRYYSSVLPSRKRCGRRVGNHEMETGGTGTRRLRSPVFIRSRD